LCWVGFVDFFVGVVGSDIQQELYCARQALESGWNYSAILVSQSNFSIITGLLAPFLSWLFCIDLLVVFKWIFPAVFALTPVVLYCAFKKQFSERVALYAALFFIIIPVFNMEIAANAKSMIAELFLAIAVWIIVSDIKNIYKLSGLILSVTLALAMHYTVGIVLVLYLFGIIFIVFFGRLFRIKIFKSLSTPLWILVIVVVVALVFGFLFFSVIGGGVLLQILSAIAIWVKNNVLGVFSQTPSASLSENVTASTLLFSSTVSSPASSVLSPSIFDSVIATVLGAFSYLQEQSSFVKYGMGLDFFDASWLGKISRIFQYFTQIMILLGIFFCLLYKKVKSEFVAGVLIALFMLLMCIFIPSFSAIANMTRFYHFALFFLAPCFVLGFDIFKKAKWWIFSFVFIMYYVFASGIVFEVTKVSSLDKFDVPFSHALSAERLGSAGIYTQDDLNCAKWLAEKSDVNLRILGDQNAGALISSYMYYYPRMLNDTSVSNSFPILTNSPYYLFLTDWNYRNHKYVVVASMGTGLRRIISFPDLTNAVEVYSSGNSRVYLME
jgi:uncharacterized membrane protein